MVWFKVDDNLAFHQKTLRAGNAAMGMWVRAGSECASQLTDGFVSAELVRSLGGPALAKRLVDARLWLQVDGGYQFHEWSADGRQPTRVQVEAERKEARLRKERWREKRRNGEVTASGTDESRVTERGTNGSHARAATRPDPTRPVKEQPQEHRSAEPSTPDRFDEFWAAYPLKRGKQAAQRRWDTLIDRGVDPTAVIAGAKAYAIEVRGKDPKFVKYPEGWLNAGRWQDVVPAANGTPARTPHDSPWDS